MAVTRILLPDDNTTGPNTRDYTPESGESWKQAGDKINASMVRSGLTEIDFGAFPGSDTATLAVTGQDDIAATASLSAVILYKATDDHTADEHIVDPPRVIAGNIVAGTGFTIYGTTATNQLVYGKWSVGWRWSN